MGKSVGNSIERLLTTVTKPGRYTGGEWNSVTKPWDAASLRVALAFPDLYEVGTPYTTSGILYETLNSQHSFLAERVFAPWLDLRESLLAEQLPLFTLESRKPLGEFDLLAFEVNHALSFPTVLDMLNLAEIPLRQEYRGIECPIVLAWGDAVHNPEPLSPFLDAVLLGDPEIIVPTIMAAMTNIHPDRKTVLEQLAVLPGVYVPSLYQVAKGDITPLHSGVPFPVPFLWLDTLPSSPTHPIVPYLQTAHDRAIVEIKRGCTQDCRSSCLGVTRTPKRSREAGETIALANQVLDNTGYENFSLTADCTYDIPNLVEMIKLISQVCQKREVELSVPGVHMDQMSVELIESLRGLRQKNLSFAPEIINSEVAKLISNDQFIESLQLVERQGLSSLQLELLLGHPTQQERDVDLAIDLVRQIRRMVGRKVRMRLTVNSFIPQPHTPFDRTGHQDSALLHKAIFAIKTSLQRTNVVLSWTDVTASQVETALIRGGREMGDVIEHAWNLGCSLDTWGSQFNAGRWNMAFQRVGLNLNYQAERPLAHSSRLPWSHLDIGVDTRSFQDTTL